MYIFSEDAPEIPIFPPPIGKILPAELKKAEDSIYDCLPKKQLNKNIIARLTLTLYKNPTYHNWNQLTALEDDLSRVIQIS